MSKMFFTMTSHETFSVSLFKYFMYGISRKLDALRDCILKKYSSFYIDYSTSYR